MCVGRQLNRDRVGQNVIMGYYNFARVRSFRYLEITITECNNITEKLKDRIQSTNPCLVALSRVLKSEMLSRITKIKIYKTIQRPILLY